MFDMYLQPSAGTNKRGNPRMLYERPQHLYPRLGGVVADNLASDSLELASVSATSQFPRLLRLAIMPERFLLPLMP